MDPDALPSFCPETPSKTPQLPTTGILGEAAKRIPSLPANLACQLLGAHGTSCASLLPRRYFPPLPRRRPPLLWPAERTLGVTRRAGWCLLRPIPGPRWLSYPHRSFAPSGRRSAVLATI